MKLISRLLYCTCCILTWQDCSFLNAQTNPDDYWLNHGFTSGQTVITNSGYFYDDGGNNNYNPGQSWNVRFCSENGNPITVDFSGFATYYGGPFPNPPPGAYASWDYMTINYPPSSSYVAYHDDTPQFSFTAPGGCITFGFRSQSTSPTHTGWVAEISANPPPANNDPCTAAELTVGNVCSPLFFNNKGAYDTRGFGSPPCHTFFGGDVWFKAIVPASGELKIETFAGTLDWAVMVLYSGSDCNTLTYISCDETTSTMPTRILTGRTPGENIYIRIFGDQAKSGTFGICATDPTTVISGFTGPGGVGDKYTNDLWLRADKDVMNNSDNPVSNGESIKTWTDQSGNNNHVTQATSGNQPTFATSALNGYPVIRCDGTDDYMRTELNNLSAPITIMTVSRFNVSEESYILTLGDFNTTNTASISRETDDRYFCFTGSKRYGPVLANNQTYILHAAHKIASQYHNLYVNETSASVSDYGSSLITDGSFILGASRSIGSFLDGDIAEVIIFNKILNQAQKIIVENYLAAKYGITLATTDRYAWEASHGFDVAGIGMVNASNIHTKAQSARILSIGGATDLENNEFLLFGHDNGSIASWSTTERPNGDSRVQRIAREWRVDISGGDGPGPVNISINDSLLPGLPAGFASYNIWIDADGNFASGAVPYPVVPVGNEYVANSVPLNDGDFITLGAVQPIISFTTDSSSNFESIANPTIQVQLNYAVSYEVSIDYAVKNGTATQGVDYSLIPGTLKINPGTKTGNIIPLIFNDTIVEVPDEYFTIRIYNPSSGILLNQDTLHTYTIINDDIEIEAFTDTDTIGSCYNSHANLSVTVQGIGPYSYSWTPIDSLSNATIQNPIANPSSSVWYKVTVTDLPTSATTSDSVFITVIPLPSKPNITTGGPLTFCEGDSVLLTSSDAVGYFWSNGENTKNIYAKSSGSYTVHVTDANSCTSTESDPVNITAIPGPAKPLITVTGKTEFCEGESTILTSSDGDSYSWSNGETTKSITVQSSGSYNVRIQVAAGCYSLPSDSIIIQVYNPPAKPVITGDAEYCAGGAATITSEVPEAGYIWSNGDTLASINVTAGNYSLKVINEYGCQSESSDPFTVTENPLPAKPVISGAITYCKGEATELTSSSANSYLWSNGDTTQTIVVTQGIYSVVTGDAKGCFSINSDIITVTELLSPEKPVITADGPVTIWEGDDVALESSPAFTYMWSPGGETSRQIVVNVSGSFSVIIGDENGCLSISSDTVTVTVQPLGKPVISASGPLSFCHGGNVTLTAPEASQYLWSDGSTSRNITVEEPGNYTLIIYNEIGQASPESDPVITSVFPDPVVSITTSPVSCHGFQDGSATATPVQGSSPFSYNWSSGSTESGASNLAAGTYNLAVTDANGCTCDTLVQISEPSAISITGVSVNPTCPESYNGSISVTVTGGISPYSYNWSTEDQVPEITGLGPGTYTLQITDASNCTADYNESIQSDRETCIIVPDIITPNGDGYNDTWEIEGAGYYEDIIVEVFDRWGKRVFHSDGYPEPWNGTYNNKELPMDSYHYVIRSDSFDKPIIGNITIVR
jgi:gliding motility-associated-like protein